MTYNVLEPPSKLPLYYEQYKERNHNGDDDENNAAVSGGGEEETTTTTYWMLHAVATTSDEQNSSTETTTNKEEDMTDRQKSHRQRRRTTQSIWRNLFDQFVGEDIPPSSSSNNNNFEGTVVDDENATSSSGSSIIDGTTNTVVNVTTEVEITETVIVEENPTTTTNNDTAGSMWSDDDNNNQPSNGDLSSSDSTTAGTSTSSGSPNQNTTTNVTETVIYTENTNVTSSTGDGTAGQSSTTGLDGDGGTTSDGIHDHDPTEPNTNSTLVENVGPVFQPLRIRAILAEKSSSSMVLNDTERNALFHEMLSPALLAWSSSLRVDPVVGNLTVDVNQLVDGKTCGPGIDSGLPSIQVPIQHLEEGIPDTDLIVYLSLGRAVSARSSNTTNSTTQDGNDGSETDIDSDGNNDENQTSTSTVTGGPMGGKRREDKDFGMQIKEIWGGLRRRLELNNPNEEGTNQQKETKKVSIQDDKDRTTNNGSTESGDDLPSASRDNTTGPINICTGEYLAAASYCSTDQYDRPTAALLHICIGDDFFDPKNRKRNIMTLMHELAHALGFNSLSMAHFRRPDGTPYTPRDENGDIPETEVECTGPGLKHQYATLALPSEEILQFRTVRGGVRVAEIVTPSVVQVVRNQFDCQLLTGAELESGEGLPLSILGEEGCIGDHWERRLFQSDLMNPIVDDLDFSSRISTLTLAYFADSGWYQVDLSQANVAPGWGRGAGCGFVNDTCVSTTTGEVPPQNAPFFCNEISSPSGFSLTPRDIHGCTPDLTRKAKCSIGQYDLDLPAAYQYFNNTYGADVGGSDSLMDFCPVYDGFENGLCASAESAKVVRAIDIERFGQRNSRCLTGSALPFHQNMALCLPIACVIEDRSFRIKVNNDWHICADAGNEIMTDSVIITCPDPRRVCPTFFCPYDCLGTGGRCDYMSGKCMCEYEGIYVGNETVVDECGLTKHVNTTTVESPHRPFVQRQEQEAIDPARPPPDTALSDYYFDGVDKLRDEPLIMKPWMIALLCVIGFILLSLGATLFTVGMKPSSSENARNFRFWRPFWSRYSPHNGEDDAERFDDDGPVNTDKDKMVATVLVDLRVNGNQRWRFPQRQPPAGLNDSIADTEDRLTDSEIASDARIESLSDIDSSFRQSEGESISDQGAPVLDDLEGFQDMITLDTPAIGEESQVIRRRRVGEVLSLDYPPPTAAP